MLRTNMMTNISWAEFLKGVINVFYSSRMVAEISGNRINTMASISVINLITPRPICLLLHG